MTNQKYSIFIQARVSSSRSPAKVLHMINGKPMLLRQLERLRFFAPNLHIACVTSDDPSDNAIEDICNENNFDVFRGPLNNVLSRYIQAAEHFKTKYIIRVGGDDPLIDPGGCLKLIDYHQSHDGDFLYLSHKNGWPYGTASELISVNALKYIENKTTSEVYKEHIIPFFKDNPDIFKVQRINSPPSLSRPNYYFSVDYQEDIAIISRIFETLINLKGEYFTIHDVIKLCDDDQSIIESNQNLHDGFDD
ncbi:hypothetical protein N9H97_03645 [Gammaproteobacteria bacterium]|nr:hypothetical protein [Gammaproteobacteria bacterium]